MNFCSIKIHLICDEINKKAGGDSVRFLFFYDTFCCFVASEEKSGKKLGKGYKINVKRLLISHMENQVRGGGKIILYICLSNQT